VNDRRSTVLTAALRGTSPKTVRNLDVRGSAQIVVWTDKLEVVARKRLTNDLKPRPLPTRLFVSTRPRVQKSRNPYVKTVSVNGRPVNGLIDTGSSAVLMRISAARKCNVAIRDAVCPLYTVGNATQPSTSTIGEGDAEISIEGVLAADHTIKIVPDSAIPVDVLVGRTWLDLPHVNYFKQGGEIVFDSMNRVQTDAFDMSYADENVYVAVEESDRPTKVPITENDVVIDSSVSVLQRETLVALLNEYRDAFAKNITELGCTDGIDK